MERGGGSRRRMRLEKFDVAYDGVSVVETIGVWRPPSMSK